MGESFFLEVGRGEPKERGGKGDRGGERGRGIAASAFQTAALSSKDNVCRGSLEKEELLEPSSGASVPTPVGLSQKGTYQEERQQGGPGGEGGGKGGEQQ